MKIVHQDEADKRMVDDGDAASDLEWEASVRSEMLDLFYCLMSKTRPTMSGSFADSYSASQDQVPLTGC